MPKTTADHLAKTWRSLSRMLEAAYLCVFDARREHQYRQDGMSQNPANPNPTPWPWPDSLDALAAAPGYHQLLLEDERVRVLHTRIAAGVVVPLHTHRWGGVAYVQSFSHFIRRGEKGEVLFDSRQSGDPPKTPCAQWMPPLPPHTVENLGPSEISILIVEVKNR